MQDGEASTVSAALARALAAESADAPLLRALEAFGDEGDLASQVQLFESVLWQRPLREDRIWHRMSGVYGRLGRQEACVFCAAMAVHGNPDGRDTFDAYRVLLGHFRERNRPQDAAAVLLQHQGRSPGAPLATPEETQAVLQAGAPAAPDAVLTGILAVLRDSFGQPGLIVDEVTAQGSVPGWDALSHPALIMNLERAFGVQLPSQAALALDSVGSLAAALRTRLAERDRPPARPKLVLWGSAQMAALGAVLSTTRLVAERFEVVWQPATAAELDLAGAAAFLRQDLPLWQAHPQRDRVPRTLAQAVVPFLHVQALWPFDPLGSGTDALLERLRRETADPEEVFRRYHDLDHAGVPDITRLATLDEARLLRMDRLLGGSVGRFMVENMRSMRLFHAPGRPAAALMQRVVASALDALGIAAGADGLAAYEAAAARDQLPLHPRVIAALSVSWATAETAYQRPDGARERFTHWLRRAIAGAGSRAAG